MIKKIDDPIDSGSIVKLLVSNRNSSREIKLPKDSGSAFNLLFDKYRNLSDVKFPIDSGSMVKLLLSNNNSSRETKLPKDFGSVFK
jgi:hypothetical protein